MRKSYLIPCTKESLKMEHEEYKNNVITRNVAWTDEIEKKLSMEVHMSLFNRWQVQV